MKVKNTLLTLSLMLLSATETIIKGAAAAADYVHHPLSIQGNEFRLNELCPEDDPIDYYENHFALLPFYKDLMDEMRCKEGWIYVKVNDMSHEKLREYFFNEVIDHTYLKELDIYKESLDAILSNYTVLKIIVSIELIARYFMQIANREKSEKKAIIRSFTKVQKALNEAHDENLSISNDYPEEKNNDDDEQLSEATGSDSSTESQKIITLEGQLDDAHKENQELRLKIDQLIAQQEAAVADILAI